jgi:hypothetical protein
MPQQHEWVLTERIGVTRELGMNVVGHTPSEPFEALSELMQRRSPLAVYVKKVNDDRDRAWVLVALTITWVDPQSGARWTSEVTIERLSV